MVEMEQFDFNAPAEVFAFRGRRGTSQPMIYRSFPTGAEAVRHVMEALDGQTQKSAIVESDDARLGAVNIAALYASPDYPLERRQHGATSVESAHH